MDHQQAITRHAVERYLLNELADNDRDAFEEHYFSCTDCAEDVRMAALMRDGTRAGMAAPGVATADHSAKVIPIERSRRWTVSTVIPWAVAATLAMVAGYQSLWVVPGLQRELAVDATTPILLRPASRGAVTNVTRPQAGVIAFALDINVADLPSSLTYDLRTVDGNSVASGVVTAPPAGTPLLLVVPAAKLTSPGAYQLTLRGSGGTNPPVAEYRFAVAEP